MQLAFAPGDALAGSADNAGMTRTLNDWLAYIERQHPTSIDMGLERVRRVASRLGLGRPAARVISVAGTNGALNGDFFGTGASAVAGTVKFADRSKDTAFGGSKN